MKLEKIQQRMMLYFQAITKLTTKRLITAWIIQEWIRNSKRHRFEMKLLAILIGGASG